MDYGEIELNLKDKAAWGFVVMGAQQESAE